MTATPESVWPTKPWTAEFRGLFGYFPITGGLAVDFPSTFGQVLVFSAPTFDEIPLRIT